MTPRHMPWADAPSDFSIGLRPIAEADWLEGGAADPERKRRLLAEHPELVWGETSGSRAAQEHALRLVEAVRPDQVEAAANGREPAPLWRASLMVADDLCLMEKHDGHWRLTAASLCSPTFFTVAEALGRSLAQLHGPVPDYDRRFLPRVERIFDRLAPGQILERRNWTVVNSGELFLPASAPVKARILDIAPEQAAEALFLRVERQTLRKLTETAAVFTIRIWRDPLAALIGRPELLDAFAHAWRTAPAAFRVYKGLARYDVLVEGLLGAAGTRGSDRATSSR